MFKIVYFDISNNDIAEMLFDFLESKGYLVKNLDTIKYKIESMQNENILLIFDYENFCIFNKQYKNINININIICLIPNNLIIADKYDNNIKFYEIPKKLINLMNLF